MVVAQSEVLPTLDLEEMLRHADPLAQDASVRAWRKALGDLQPEEAWDEATGLDVTSFVQRPRSSACQIFDGAGMTIELE